MGDNQDGENGGLGGQQTRSQVTRELSFLTDGGLELKLLGEDLEEKWKRYRAVINAYLGVDGND